MTKYNTNPTAAKQYESRGKRRRPIHQPSSGACCGGIYPNFFWKRSTEYLFMLLILASNNHQGNKNNKNNINNIMVSAQSTISPSMISTSDASESVTIDDGKLLAIGQECEYDAQCQSGYCDIFVFEDSNTNNPHLCWAKKENGMMCDANFQCASNICLDFECTESNHDDYNDETTQEPTLSPTVFDSVVGGDDRLDNGEVEGDLCIPLGTESCAVARCPGAPEGCQYKTDHYVMGLTGICCPQLCYLVDSNNPEMECGSSSLQLTTTGSPTTEVTDQEVPPPTPEPTLYIKTLPPTPDPTSLLSSPTTTLLPTLVGSNRQDIPAGGEVPIQTNPDPTTDEPTPSLPDEPTFAPFEAPPLLTREPTSTPSDNPISSPSFTPSARPTFFPTTSAPTWNPTMEPTTESPTISPTTSPSDSPTISPSQRPSKNPTRQPSVHPTEAPTITPSSQPSPFPTPLPTLFPTAAPVPWPTREPTPSPTISPTTASPTPDPTKSPSVSPSAIPSTSPSSSPTRTPSSTPSDAPSLVPTISALPTTETPKPTVSARPSDMPSTNPTDHPSTPPSDFPSSSPSQLPSDVPSTSPSQAPSLSLQNEGERVEMTLKYSDVLEGLSIITWEQITATHIRQSILKMNVEPPVEDLRVWTNIVRQTPQQIGAVGEGDDDTIVLPEATAILSDSRVAANQEGKPTSPVRTGAGSGVRRRQQQQETPQQLQEDGNVPLKIAFDTAVSYRSLGQDHDIQVLISGAFVTDEDREDYINSLKRTNDGAFQNLNEVVSVSVGGVFIPEEEETIPPSSEGRDMTIFIIIGAAAGGGALVLLILFLLWRRYATKSHHQHQSLGKTEPGASTLYDSNANGVTTEIVVEHNPDEVSTLGDPMYTPNGMMMGMMNTMEREEERTASVGDDYDYKYLKHHNFSNGNGEPPRDRVMSDDTRSRLMSDEDLTRQSSGKTGSQSKLGLSQMGESIFSDDASFEEQYTEPEEQVPFEITVPAGKLGMVIDTPNGGFPIVHAIKDTSILADRVRVGDRLVSVDGQDCTPMTAVQVSKLISLKSEQESRVLVFVRKRTTRPGGG